MVSEVEGDGDVAAEVLAAMNSAQSALAQLKTRLEVFNNAVEADLRRKRELLDDASMPQIEGGHSSPGDAQEMTDIWDRLSQLNTKCSVLLHEAQDGEARVAGLISEYKCLLSEMRK